MTYNDYVYQLLLELSTQNNFKVTGFSENYILEIKNDKKCFYVYGNCFPLNDATSQKLCYDKNALSLILKRNNIDCLEHELFKNPNYEPNFNISILE